MAPTSATSPSGALRSLTRSLTAKKAAACASSIALGAASAIALPATAQAQTAAAPTSPPNGTTSSCDAVLTTSNTLDLNALDYGQNAQSISRQFSIGIQKFSTGSGTVNWRPWVKFFNLQGRTVKNTTATFTQSSNAAGPYTVTNQELGTHFTVPVKMQVTPDKTSLEANDSFTADLGDYNAPAGSGWGGAGVMWVVNGPDGNLKAADPQIAKSTLTLNTTYVPLTSETNACRPIEISGTAKVLPRSDKLAANGMTVNAREEDAQRLSGIVYKPGTDEVIEGATVKVANDGRVLVSVPQSNETKSLDRFDIQLTATPRSDAEDQTPVNIGSRFSQPLRDVVKPPFEPTNGDNTDWAKCGPLDWTAGAIMNTEWDDYSNTGYTKKVKDYISPGTRGAMEMQHWRDPGVLYWRLPVGTDEAISGGKLRVTLPDLPGAKVTAENGDYIYIAPDHPFGIADNGRPNDKTMKFENIEINGNVITADIDMPAGTHAVLMMSQTVPADTPDDKVLEATAHLTGDLPDCKPETTPGGGDGDGGGNNGGDHGGGTDNGGDGSGDNGGDNGHGGNNGSGGSDNGGSGNGHGGHGGGNDSGSGHGGGMVQPGNPTGHGGNGGSGSSSHGSGSSTGSQASHGSHGSHGSSSSSAHLANTGTSDAVLVLLAAASVFTAAGVSLIAWRKRRG
ncbi:hypothetical protein [Corynebacterium falsenii]